MFCPHCGQQLNDDAKFCFSCGNRLDNTGQSCRKKKKTGKFILVFLIVILIVAAVIGYISFRNASEQDHKQQLGIIAEPEETWQTLPGIPDDEPVETTEGEIPQESTEYEDITPETTSEKAGIPLPSQPKEVRKKILEIYKETIASEANAVSYGLLNMLGDDIPELIIRCDNGDGRSFYQIYFVLSDQVLQVQGTLIPAGKDDVLMGNNGSLLICRQNVQLTTVCVDKSLSANLSDAILQEPVAYTDSVLMEDADNSGLLELSLMGNNGKTWYSGWVRFDGKDYFYTNRKPETRKWRNENGVMYYLGSSGYVTHKADQESLEAVMNEYCQGFMDAANHQDVTYLKNVTDAHRQEIGNMLKEDMYQYRTFSDFVCSITVSHQDHSTGSLTVNANIQWISCGTWEGANSAAWDRLMSVTLVNRGDGWLVDSAA